MNVVGRGRWDLCIISEIYGVGRGKDRWVRMGGGGAIAYDKAHGVEQIINLHLFHCELRDMLHRTNTLQLPLAVVFEHSVQIF